MTGAAYPSDSIRGTVLQDRAICLFRFLRELARLRSRTIRDLSDYEEVVWFCDVPVHKGCFSVLSPDPDATQDSTWLEIKKSPEPKTPPIPAACQRWLDSSNEDDPETEPALRDEIPVDTDHPVGSESDVHAVTESSTDSVERLSDYPDVQEAWDRWKEDSWRPWFKVYSQWKAADDIYFKLFSIHQQMRKLAERYELLLGLGLLTWETPNNQVIKRHIVVGDAYLTFDANKAKFELQAAPEGVKLHLETEMIDQTYLPPLDQQRELESMLGLVQESPWNREEIDSILRSFIHSMSSQGTYSDALVPPDKSSKAPVLTFAPAIILRQRTQRSQIQALSNVIEQVGEGGHIPSGIRLFCEELGTSEERDESYETTDVHLTEETLYLPLPTNDEQKQIIYQIQSQNGILVQGPPGTGKSHTIANIICHLLAQGKRVLVTSQTPRALKVLKEKIPPDMAALCVTILGNDQAARQELEESVSGINQRYSDWNPAHNQELITTLEAHLYELRKDKANHERLLRERREIDTYRHEVVGGAYKGTAQQIAVRLASERSRFAWLEDAVGDGQACPLSDEEFSELIRLCRELPADYCTELKQELVSRESVPDLALFIKTVDQEAKTKHDLAECESRFGSLRYRILQQSPDDDVRALHRSISDLVAAMSSIVDRFPWIQDATADVLAGDNAPWKGLRDFMAGRLSGLLEKATVAHTLDVRFPEHVNRKRLRVDASKLLNHLESGGRMGWAFLAPKAVRDNRYILKQVRVDGQACRTLEMLRSLVTYLDAMEGADSLWSALQGIDERGGGSLLLQVGQLQERLKALEEVLCLEEHLSVARHCLQAIPDLPEPQWSKVDQLEEMIADIHAIELEHAFKRVVSVIESAIQSVRIARSSACAHSLNQDILSAMENRDAQAFARCLEKMESLENGRAALFRRDDLHGRLDEAAPRLALQLQDTFMDKIWDQRAEAFVAAWKWKIADEWLQRFGKEHDETKLEIDLRQIMEDERSTVSKLATAKAWDNCLRNLTPYRRNNLIAWATTMRKIGKGTGKRAPIYRRQAQEYMDNCKGAIPAWIMPLYRVFETVSLEPESFDAVIIDEASQTGPEGLIIGYLGKQCIVVGDSEQIAPEAVGVDQSEVDTLARRYLEGIPFMGLYNPQTSLFEFANILFSGKVVLREHFRSMPEIIQFSNELCYRSTPLKPLRQYPPNRLEPVLVRHVQEGFREGSPAHALNRPEADALVEMVVRMCASKEYDGKTIGLISLQGEAQAKHIENSLMTRLNPSDLESRRIVCGDAYAFQGDERDIILLSMVAAPNERIGALVREADRRRFNVAASRAKDQVVLFHTAVLSDLHPECMRHKLLEYYLNPTQQSYDVDLSLCESQFERDVCKAIVSKGYEVVPQYRVAEYRIDLVVVGTRSQLAVECDGDEWHGIEQYEQDQARQRILERCGWRFWRIRGYEHYHDPSGSLEPLWRTLAEMGIAPKGALEEERRGVITQEASTSDGVDSRTQPEGAPRPKSAVDAVRQEPTEDNIADAEQRRKELGNMEIILVKEKETPGTWRYKEKTDDRPMRIYLTKEQVKELGNPDSIKVTIAAA